ncbi:MAG TPA: 2TM domain-containing protein [bacterium]|nr:2TM domain-containing protein [bacterium]
MQTDETRLRAARRRAGRKLSFYIHAVVYAVVMIVLATINVLTAPTYPWVIFPFLGWGIGLLAHGTAAFGVFDAWYRKLVEQELKKQP